MPVPPYLAPILVFLVALGAPPGASSGVPSPPTAPAVEVRFHYQDLDRAVRFYREHLGLVPVETREDAVVLEVAPGAFLTLATMASGGFAPGTPRTAAVALVTDHLEAWWGALSDRGLDLRTETFDPEPGRAHHGFVLADPEGWLLEFERFNPHAENVGLLPRLQASPARPVAAAAAGLPEGLGFRAMILWLYYEDLAQAERFARDTLGLPLVVDQGWAKIHPVAPAAWLGLVDGGRGLLRPTPEQAVALEFLDPRVGAWGRWLEDRGLPVERPGPGTVAIRDPGGHRLRWRDPGGPEAHADYVVLGRSVNTRQAPEGTLRTLNAVFFAEIFETALGGVSAGVLEGPGAAAPGLPFPEGRVHFLAGTRRRTLAELSELYPDGTYRFRFDTPAGPVEALPVVLGAGSGSARGPGPIRLTLRQEGRPVPADAVDPDRDLEVAWTPFEHGAADPRGIADDMIYVIFGNCLGRETVHSGHAISDGDALTYRATGFTIPAAALHPGEPHQLEVEHSDMETGRVHGIETIATRAATTFLDVRTLGAASGDRDCPPEPWAMDGGQTDRRRPPDS